MSKYNDEMMVKNQLDRDHRSLAKDDKRKLDNHKNLKKINQENLKNSQHDKDEKKRIE